MIDPITSVYLVAATACMLAFLATSKARGAPKLAFVLSHTPAYKEKEDGRRNCNYMFQLGVEPPPSMWCPPPGDLSSIPMIWAGGRNGRGRQVPCKKDLKDKMGRMEEEVGHEMACKGDSADYSDFFERIGCPDAAKAMMARLQARHPGQRRAIKAAFNEVFDLDTVPHDTTLAREALEGFVADFREVDTSDDGRVLMAMLKQDLPAESGLIETAYHAVYG